MGINIIAFIVVLLGVVLYSIFLGVQQRRLTRELKLLQQLHDRSESSLSSKPKAA